MPSETHPARVCWLDTKALPAPEGPAHGTKAVRVPAGGMQIPKRVEQPRKHAAAGSAAVSGVDRESVTEPLRQRAPLAAILQDVQNRIDEGDVRNPYIPAANREKGVDFRALFCCDLFHDCAPLDFMSLLAVT